MQDATSAFEEAQEILHINEHEAIVKVLGDFLAIEDDANPVEELIATLFILSNFKEPQKMISLAYIFGKLYLEQKERADKLEATITNVMDMQDAIQEVKHEREEEEIDEDDEELEKLKLILMRGIFKSTMDFCNTVINAEDTTNKVKLFILNKTIKSLELAQSEVKNVIDKLISSEQQNEAANV